MSRAEKEVIVIKKSNLFYVIIAIIFFLIGFFIGTKNLFKTIDQKTIENCRKFCEFIPDTEFSHVDANRHCYCTQKNQRIFDRLLNKTLIYTKTVDVGIISDVVIKGYIEQA